MDTSVASLNRSTFEERQKNVTFLRSLYFLLALQLLIAVGWTLVVLNVQSIFDWVNWAWGLALALEIVAGILLLVVFFVPAVNNGGVVGMIIYILFTLIMAYLWGYWSTLNEFYYAFYVLLLLTGIAIGFAAYTW